MHNPCCFLILLSAASNAHAAALYKCGDSQKDAVSIQSAQCSAGSKLIRVEMQRKLKCQIFSIGKNRKPHSLVRWLLTIEKYELMGVLV